MLFSILPWILICLISLIIILRYFWLKDITKSWNEVVALYLIESGQKLENKEFDELSQTIPFYQMLITIWIWDFRKFLINQDGLSNIIDFYIEKGIIKLSKDDE